jgi:putative flippase GtrA
MSTGQPVVYGQMARFVAVGLVVTAADFVVYWIALSSGLPAYAANGLGMATGFVLGLFAHNRFTFQSAHAVNRATVLRYGITFGINLAIGTACIQLCLAMGLGAAVAKLVTIAVITVSNFVLSKLWVFKPAD